MKHYEQFVRGEIAREELRMTLDAADEVWKAFVMATQRKEVYERQYKAFRKMLSASCRDIPLSEILDCIDKIVIDKGSKIVVKFKQVTTTL